MRFLLQRKYLWLWILFLCISEAVTATIDASSTSKKLDSSLKSTSNKRIEEKGKNECEPYCPTGKECVTVGIDRKCQLTTVFIILIVVFSIIGLIVIIAAISTAVMCYCAAFKQDALSRIFIRRRTATEVARDRRRHLSKIRNGPVYPSNYFEETRKKRLEGTAAVANGGIINGSPRNLEDNTSSSGNAESKSKQQPGPPKNGENQKADTPKNCETKSKSLMEVFPPASCTQPVKDI